ncbi:MAG: hypothetical protein WB586_02220 [Chthoniobacterales bacterium]
MKNFLAFVVAVLGILAAAPNASQAQGFTLGFGDGPGYYAPGYYPSGYYGYPYYSNDYYNPGLGYYYYHRRVYYPESYYRGYYYGPRHRYYRWRQHDLHEWNHD